MPLPSLFKRWLERNRTDQSSDLAPARQIDYAALIEGLSAFVFTCQANPNGRWLYVSPQIESLLGFRAQQLQDDPSLWFKRIHPDDLERVQQAWTHSGETGEPLHLDFRMLASDRREVWLHGHAVVVRMDGQPSRFQGVAFDITELKRAELSSHREADQMAALTRISREITSVPDLPAVLASVARHAAELCKADASGVYLVQPDNFLRIAASFGVGAEFVQVLNSPGVPLGQGAIGRAVVERRPIVIPDIGAEPNYPFADLARLENIRAVLAVPMPRGDEVSGGIVLWQRRPHYFPSREIAFLQAIAQQCVNAVENARLLDAEREQRLLAETLRDTAAALSRTTNLEEIVERVLSDIGRVVPHDAASILLVEGGFARLVRCRSHSDSGRTSPFSASPFPAREFPALQKMMDTVQPFIAADISSHPDWKGIHYAEWVRSSVGAPIQVKGQVIGSVILDSSVTGFFNRTQAGHLQAFASQAAIAIENARLLEETSRRAERLALLNRLARAVNRTLEIDDLLDVVHREISSILPSDAFFIALCDRISNELEYRVLVDRDGPVPPDRLPLTAGLSGVVVATQKSLLVRDLAQEKTQLPPMELWGTNEAPSSWLGVPMLVDGEVVGIVSVQSYHPNAYGDAELELLSTIADTVAVAIHKARLFHETRQRARQLTVLNAAAIQVQQTFDTYKILRVACEQVQPFGTFSQIFLLAGEERLQHVHLSMDREMRMGYRAAFGEKRPELFVPLSILREDWERLSAGETYLSTDFLARVIPQMPSSDRSVAEWILEHSRREPILLAPLTRANSTVGAIVVGGERVRETDIPALALFARHVSVALDNARLFQEIQQELVERKRAEERIQRQLQRLAALHSIETAISTSLDLRIMLNIILDQVTSQLSVDAADILLYNPYLQMLEFAAERGFRSRVIHQTQLPLRKGYAGRAAAERQIVNIPDLAQADGPFLDLLRQADEGMVSYLALPLVAKSEIMGVLEVFHRRRFEPDQESLDFLATLAAQTAIAIDNMELFDTLQRSNAELSLAYDTTLEGWSRALELRDRETKGHTMRVAEMTVRLARAMGVSQTEVVHIRRGALLHDIGKMGIPDSILLKPGPLTAEEWQIMHNHPTHAYELLSPITYLRPALDIPYCHHEKWDGTGYPRGLVHEQIPLAARIFAAVDIWDALGTERPYRGAWSQDHVREHITSLSGTHLDPSVVEAFLRLDELR